MTHPPIHATRADGIDATLCGFGEEGVPGPWGGDEEEGPPVMAQTGEVVTCEDCIAIIDYCKTFKRRRQP